MIPTLPRKTRKIATALATGLTLLLQTSTHAQLPPSPSGPPLSSGSGSGTGTGMEGGAAGNTTGTGLESGAGNSTGTGSESGSGPSGLPRGGSFTAPGFAPPGFRPDPVGFGGVSGGPGATTTFPDDPSLVPLSITAGAVPGATEGSRIQPALLQNVRSIPDPVERSLALQRLANVAIFSNQLGLSHAALNDAAAAALQIQAPLIRDQRLIATITTLTNLADAHLREGKVDISMPEVTNGAEALPQVDRDTIIRRARLEWRRGAYLAGRISNITYRSEMLYRIVDNQAYASLTIANEFPRAGGTRPDVKSPASSYDAITRQIISEAANQALQIERPVWRDQALLSASQDAALAKQYDLALNIARLIPQPEIRTTALGKIADNQARSGDANGATSTYLETARAVASIPLSDPRSVLAGVLVDDLIAVGRFDDARASTSLYPDESHRLIALGAIAESQGRRGDAGRARAWIAREVPANYRSQLLRRVDVGVLSAIEQNRSRDLSNREP